MTAAREDSLLGGGEGLKSQPGDKWHQPTARQCSLLILRLMQSREQETNREVSRARISQNTIRRLAGRSHMPSEFLLDVQETLLAAGWCLFLIGPSYFGIIRVNKVEGWGRISSKRIGDELKSVPIGRYNFDNLEPLLLMAEKDPEEEEDQEE
jgi:hypothetical protein